MRKIIICLSIFIIISGCTIGKIIVQKDDFKNATIVSLELYNNPDEWTGPRAEFKYLKEIINNDPKPTVIYLKIDTSSDSSYLEQKVIVQVDNNNYQLMLVERVGELHTKKYVAIQKIFSSKFTLTKEIEENILAASKLRIRIYLGTEPVTYTIVEGDLAKIKEFLRIQSSDKKL